MAIHFVRVVGHTHPHPATTSYCICDEENLSAFAVLAEKLRHVTTAEGRGITHTLLVVLDRKAQPVYMLHIQESTFTLEFKAV